jgi:hypothetical protein
VEQLVASVLAAGRRRGQAEFALKVAELLGLGDALDLELALPPLRIGPLMREPAAPVESIDDGPTLRELAAPSVPSFVPRELTGAVVIPAVEKRPARRAKP